MNSFVPWLTIGLTLTGLRGVSIFDAFRATSHTYYRVTKNKSTSAMQHLSANGSLHTWYDSVMTAVAAMVELLTPRGYLEAVCRTAEEFFATIFIFFSGKSLATAQQPSTFIFIRSNANRKCSNRNRNVLAHGSLRLPVPRISTFSLTRK